MQTLGFPMTTNGNTTTTSSTFTILSTLTTNATNNMNALSDAMQPKCNLCKKAVDADNGLPDTPVHWDCLVEREHW